MQSGVRIPVYCPDLAIQAEQFQSFEVYYHWGRETSPLPASGPEAAFLQYNRAWDSIASLGAVSAVPGCSEQIPRDE